MTATEIQLGRSTVANRSVTLDTLARILRNPRGLVAIVILSALALAAILAGLLVSDPNAQDASGRFLAPSWEHPFGVDELRRDLFARTLFGLRSSLAIAFIAAPIGAVAGSTVGFLSGYLGRWPDALIMRIIDALLAFPGLLLALAILTVLGPGLVNVGLAVVILNLSTFARLARAQTLVEKQAEYVMAARVLGAKPGRVLFRHIVVNSLSPLVTQLALAMAAAVLLEAALSYLGLGDKPPTPSLGGLINSSRAYLQTAWWYVTFPSAFLASLLLSLNFLADAYNEAANPWRRRES